MYDKHLNKTTARNCAMLVGIKTSQCGFIVPLLLVIIATLLIGEGVYVYTQNQQGLLPM